MTTQGPQGPPPGMGGEGGPMPSEEELQAALEEQMARLTVPDVIVQTVVTLINLGARKLGLTGPPAGEGGGADRDLEQARMAIEGARALLPLLPSDIAQLREALSQLQMAYARAAGGGAPASGEAAPPPGAESASPASPGAAGGPSAPASGPSRSREEEAERAKARAKIWTPGSG